MKAKLKVIVLVVAGAALFQVFSQTSIIKDVVDGALLLFIPSRTPETLPLPQELAEAKERLFELSRENAELRKELELTPESTPGRIFARILWHDPFPLAERIRVGRGMDDGVETGAAVLVSGGRFLGRVTDVRSRTATVELLSHPSFGALSVRVGEVIGLAHATASGNFSIDFVSGEDPLESGAEVRTAGRGDGIPEGLLVGYVAEIESSPKDPFLRITATPAVSLEDEQFVFVLPYSP